MTNPSEVARKLTDTIWEMVAKDGGLKLDEGTPLLTTALTEARNEGRASTTKEERVNVQTVLAYEAGRNEALDEVDMASYVAVDLDNLRQMIAKLRGGTNGN